MRTQLRWCGKFYYSRIRISSRLKWYKNYKNRLRLAKVIVKNIMSRFLWFTVYNFCTPAVTMTTRCGTCARWRRLIGTRERTVDCITAFRTAWRPFSTWISAEWSARMSRLTVNVIMRSGSRCWPSTRRPSHVRLVQLWSSSQSPMSTMKAPSSYSLLTCLPSTKTSPPPR